MRATTTLDARDSDLDEGVVAGVHRRVVDDDDLPVAVGLSPHGFDALQQRIEAVVRGNHHGHPPCLLWDEGPPAAVLAAARDRCVGVDKDVHDLALGDR